MKICSSELRDLMRTIYAIMYARYIYVNANPSKLKTNYIDIIKYIYNMVINLFQRITHITVFVRPLFIKFVPMDHDPWSSQFIC